MQDLRSTDPDPGNMRYVDHTDYTGPAQKQELSHTWYKIGGRPALNDLHHYVGIGDLYEVSLSHKTHIWYIYYNQVNAI